MEHALGSASKEEFVRRVQEHRGIVRKICRIYGATREEREDLSQEILARLWSSYPSFRGESSFATWAYRVALNTALLSRRRSASAPRRERDVDQAELADPKSCPPGGDAADEEVRLLEACIRELPELDRALVFLHLEARPHAEIAEITGLSTGNVAVRLHRTRERLKELLIARGVRSN